MADVYDLIWAASDTLPIHKTTLTDKDNEPISLTGASVVFVLSKPNGGAVGEYSVIVEDAEAGGIKFVWPYGATNEFSGEYRGRWRVEYLNTDSLHLPNDRYLKILFT